MMSPFHFAAVLAQQNFDNDQFRQGGAESALGALCNCFVFIVVVVPIVIGMWKLFEKAGKPGWAAIIPIYNMVVLLEIVGRPIWWIILMLIPCVGFVVQIIVCVDVAKSYGRGTGTAVGLILLPLIFYPILGFGSAKYVGPAAAQPGTPAV